MAFGICYIAKNTEDQINKNFKKRDTDTYIIVERVHLVDFQILLLLVATTPALFLGTCAAPYLLLQPQMMSWAWPSNSYPAVFTLHR
jgi:hypothetical protein